MNRIMAIKRQEDHWVVIEDIRIRYWKIGRANKVILLLHGMGCSALEWSENMIHLSNQFTVIAVDMVGFGKSDKPRNFEYSAQSQARIIQKLLMTLGIKNLSLVGNSFGGRVAIELSNLLGKSVQTLTLVASAGAGKDAPRTLRLQTLPVLGPWLCKPNFHNHQLGWRSVFVNQEKISDERIHEKFQDALEKNSQYASRATLQSMLNIFGFKALDQFHKKVRAIKVPTLILWGDSDPMLPVSHAHHFKALIPQAKLIILEKCGHAPQIEHDETFNALLESFVLSHVESKYLNEHHELV